METKQIKEEKDKKYELTQEQQNQMAKFFSQMGQGKMYKQAEKASQFIFKRMKQSSQQLFGSKPQKMLTIQVGSYQNLKDCPQCNEVFILGCLIFGILKTRTLKVCFEADVRINTKNKKNENCITMYVKNRKNIDLGKRFTEYIHKMLHIEQMQLKKKYNYFGDFYIKCQSQPIQANSINELSMRNLRQGIYHFIDELYQNVTRIWQGENIYIPRNTFYSFQSKDQVYAVQQQNISRIIKYMGSFYTLELIFKIANLKVLQLLMSERRNLKEKIMYQNDEETYGRYNGFYCPFNGTPSEYLKILKIYSNYINNLSSVQNIIKDMPNLQFLYIQRQGTQIVIQQINHILQNLMVNNSSIKAFVIKNITITKVSSEILKGLLQECPFLVNLELNLTFRFQIEETYTWSGQEERQIKQQDRACQIILKVMRLRAITFDNNRDMIKLIEHDGFDFNTALQAVYCIQPMCF